MTTMDTNIIFMNLCLFQTMKNTIFSCKISKFTICFYKLTNFKNVQLNLLYE